MAGLLFLLLGGLALGLMVQGGDGDADDDAAETGGGVTRDGDTVTGTDGDDVIFGASGEDDEVFFVGGGNDFVRAGGGPDFVSDTQRDGTPGDSPGDDTVYGDGGDDTLIGVGGSDRLYGGTQDDELLAIDPASSRGGGADLLSGGWGDDTLAGDDGDTLTGGPGVDLFVPVIEDAAAEAVVQIADFEDGEFIEVTILDPGLLRDDGSDVIEAVDLGPEGTGLVVNGVPLVRLAGVAAASLDTGDYALIDATD